MRRKEDNTLNASRRCWRNIIVSFGLMVFYYIGYIIYQEFIKPLDRKKSK